MRKASVRGGWETWPSTLPIPLTTKTVCLPAEASFSASLSISLGSLLVITGGNKTTITCLSAEDFKALPHSLSLAPWKVTQAGRLVSLFQRGGNRGTEKAGSLLMVTQLTPMRFFCLDSWSCFLESFYSFKKLMHYISIFKWKNCNVQ